MSARAMIGFRAARASAQRRCLHEPLLGSCVRRQFAVSSTSVPDVQLSTQQLAGWTPDLTLEVLQQVAQGNGAVAPDMLRRLRGEAMSPMPASVAAADEADADEADADAEQGVENDGVVDAARDELEAVEKSMSKRGEHEPEHAFRARVERHRAELVWRARERDLVGVENAQHEQCGSAELVRVAELCLAFQVRDFVLLQALVETALPVVREHAPVQTGFLLRLSNAYASLGVLNQPLFNALAAGLLDAWPASAKGEGSAISPADLTQIFKNFSTQRMRHERLFDRLADMLDVTALTPEQAMSILHSHAFLRLSAELGDKLWEALEAKSTEPGLKNMSAAAIAELCYILFMARKDSNRLDDLRGMLNVLTEVVPPSSDASWSTPEGQALQKRLLMLRSYMRYLHRDSYAEIGDGVMKMFKQVHRMDSPERELRPVVNFVRKLSNVLGKLRVGHVCNAERGPFVFDVIERDRKLVYECNHFDRFYANSIEKIASMCLQERVVKAMGYRIVQVPHWQWCKIKHRRQRMEYIRMSRYYAIKDRREFSPRDDMPEDLARNEFDHLGEYFFKKEAPSSPWSWFHAPYDATRRIPDSPGS